MKKLGVTLAAASLMIASAATSSLAAGGRDYVNIVGSSTVYPFCTTVAEQFGRATQFKTPVVESTGTGGGMRLFCAGVGVETPDIANASRRMTAGEMANCQQNGVNEIVEVKVGYDGIVLANSRKAELFKMTRKELFLALAKEVPDPKGSGNLVANPYQTWNEINDALPGDKIEVLGPPPTSGTRDAFVEMVMEGGCKQVDALTPLKEADSSRYKAVCQTIREDGGYIDAGENDNLIVQKLDANPASLGIFGFSYLDQNTDKIQGAFIDGSAPTFENIASGSYVVSRPLYIYVKKAHAGVVPGLIEYLTEFTSDRAWGEDGYLTEKGLIPAPVEEREKFAADAKALKPVVLD